MPHFESVTRLPRPPVDVFDFFRRPANLLRVTPPEMNLRLVEAPEQLELGSRLVIEIKRWGLAQRLESEVTDFELHARFRDEQVKGPFRKWVHTHRFEPDGRGTRVTDLIDFEPPGGLLGLVVTVPFVERDLQHAFAFRIERLQELLGGR